MVCYIGLTLSVVQGQGPCSVDLGSDLVICQGQTVQLNAPAGLPNYLWSTGSTATNITVGSAGVYWFQTSYPSGQLVTNGNFNAGNTGFNTQFTYTPTLTLGDGHYYIGTNAASYHPQFFGTGSGNFMIVNSGWGSALYQVWCQDVTVCPGQTYTLTYRSRTLSNSTPARLQWWINGVATGVEETMPAYGAGWQTFTHTWTSPPGPTTATICLRAMSGEGVGNDFGLDDISMTGTIVLTDDVLVNVTPLPVVDLGPDLTLCQGQNLMLDAGVAGGTYLWQDGSTASTYAVSGSGDYAVTVTANGCSASDAISVYYNPLPVVDLGPDLTLCSGQSVNLNVSQPGATYTWQNGSTAGNFNVTSAGTYSVGVWLNGCFANDAVNVAYNPTPTVNLGPDQVICAGQQITLNATTPGATYLWQDGSTGPTLNVSSAGNYNVAVTVAGCTGTDAASVSVNPIPAVDLGPDQTVCPGTSVLLNATVPGAAYLWQDGSTGPTFSATQPGAYAVQVTLNGCSASDAMNLNHYSLPSFQLGPDVTICQGETTTLSALVPGATYLWSTGNTGQSITTGTPGIYWLDVTQNTCTVRDSILVSVTPLPVIDLGPDTSVCPGVQAVLDATLAGASYLWNTGASTATINAGPGNYSVQVSLNGCSADFPATVGAYPAASVSLGPDTTLCPGQQLLMDVFQPGATYLWQNGTAMASMIANSSGTYSVTLTDANGCSANDAITVSYANPTSVDLGPDTDLCQGEQLVLDVTVPGATYAWSTGAQTPTITVGQQGNYSVTVTQGNCTVGDAVMVTLVPVPSLDLGPDATLCPGDQLILDATLAGAGYLWNDGSTDATFTVTDGGTYSVVATLATGCTVTDAISISMASPNAVDLGPDQSLCQGESALLSTQLPGAQHLWSTGATGASITVASAGTYWVQVTQGSCVVGDTVAVDVLPMPQVALGPDQVLCEGENVVLDGTWPGAAYLWSTGATAPTLMVTGSGTYTVSVDLNGCVATDAVDILFQAPPAVDLGPDQDLCDGDELVLDVATANANYTWSTGSTASSITASSTGQIWVEVQVGACLASDSLELTVLPMPEVDLGPDVVLCEGESVTLDASWPGAIHAWSSGEQSPTLLVNSSGLYVVTVELNGCAASDEVEVTVQPPPQVDLGPDLVVCDGEEVNLDATVPGATYLWSDGSTGPSLNTGSGGSHWVEVLVGACTASDTMNVDVIAPGILDLGPNVALCDGDAVVLNATLSGASYLWSDGSTDPVRTITTQGTYSVVATVGPCTIQDEIEVSIVPLPVVDLGPDQELCPGELAQFNAGNPGGTYLWQDGSTANQFSTNASGSVTLTVTVNGCSSTDQVWVNILQGPSLSLGSDTTICEGADLVLNVAEPGGIYLWEDGSTDGQRTINAAGTYWVEAELNGCSAVDTITVELFVPATIDLGPDIELCPGTSATLSIPFQGPGLVWSTGETTASITVSEEGDHWVHVQVAACVAGDTVHVDVVDLILPDLGSDLVICEGDTVLLSVDPGLASITWSTGSTESSIPVWESGSYSVALELSGCFASDQVLISTLSFLDTLDLGGIRTICPDASLVLDAGLPSREADYFWSTGVSGPQLLVLEPGLYTVQIMGECVEAEGVVEVVSGNCAPLVYVPNTFTPNDDGINDRFLPIVSGTVDRYRLEIFDRWGERIHENTDPAGGWNGEVSGAYVQDGVYVWVLEYRSRTDQGVVSERLMGHVTLLR